MQGFYATPRGRAWVHYYAAPIGGGFLLSDSIAPFQNPSKAWVYPRFLGSMISTNGRTGEVDRIRLV